MPLWVGQVSEVWELHVFRILLDQTNCMYLCKWLTGSLSMLKIMRLPPFIQQETWYSFSKEGQCCCLKKKCDGMLLLVDMLLEVWVVRVATALSRSRPSSCLNKGEMCWVLRWNSPKQISSRNFQQFVVSSLNIVFHCSLLPSNPEAVWSPWQIVTSVCHTSFGAVFLWKRRCFPSLPSLFFGGVLYFLGFWVVFENSYFWDGKDDDWF